jgi:hypothetical protein
MKIPRDLPITEAAQIAVNPATALRLLEAGLCLGLGFRV